MAITKVSPDLLDLDAGITISVADNSDNLTLTSTDADANSGPNLRMYRNSSSPADSDAIGLIDFEGRNDNSQDVVYAAIDTRIVDASDGSEDGRIEIATILGGTAGVSRILMDATETVFNDNSASLDFRVEADGNANMLFVDASADRVGIGTASPDGPLHIKPTSGDTYLILEAGQSDSNAGVIYHNNSGTQVGYNLYDTDDNIYYIGVNGINRFKVQSGSHFELRGPDANSNQVKMMDSSGNIDGYLYAEASEIGFLDADGNWAMQVKTDNYVRFLVNNSEGGRFDSSGNLIVGDTAVPNGSNSCFSVSSGGTVTTSRAATNSQTHFLFMNPNGGVGSIRTNASATAFNTSSDARLKDVTGSARGLEVINALNPVAYNWKVDGKADEGLIAQEVLEVVPNAVSGSEEEYYQMDYSKLVTPLVKAIQEQQEQIEQLKAEIQTLKGE